MVINVLIIGKSPIFVEIFEEILMDLHKKCDLSIKIISWRFDLDINPNDKYNYIFICGYDYSSFSIGYKYFYKKNIIRPYLSVLSSIKSNGIIIYINTKSIESKNYTFSRYEFAKNRLAFKLSRLNFMILSISCETIVGSDGYYVNGNFLEKYLFLAASKFGLLNTIDVLALKSKIKKQILGGESDLIIPQKGIFLDYSRPRLLDRLLRFL